MVTKRKRRGALSVLAAACAVPVLGGCAILALDAFPALLSRTEATAKLDVILADQGVPTPYYIREAAFLHSDLPALDCVAVSIDSTEGRILALLDADTLAPLDIYLDSNESGVDPDPGPVLGVDEGGYIISAGSAATGLRLNPGDFSVDSEITPISEDSLLFVDAPSAYTYVVRFDSTTNMLYYDKYQGWGIYGSGSAILDGTFMNGLYLKDARSEGGTVRLLFSSYSEGRTFVLSYASAADFESACASTYLTDVTHGWADLDASSGGESWLCSGGAVAVRWRDGPGQEFVRFDPDTGAERDALGVEDSGDRSYFFSKDTARWLMYDSYTATLSLLRGWW